MNNLTNFNYPPPKNWQDFESLCKDLWRVIWNDPNTKKHGRSGQDQHGVDVYGQPDRGQEWAGVQCKGKDNTYSTNLVTETELLKEIKKAKGFKPELSEWILATTSPRDAKLETKVRKLNSDHQKKGLFTVHIWFWEDIVEELIRHPMLISLHLPQINSTGSLETLSKLDNTETAVQTLAINSTQQTATLEANSLVLEELNKKIDSVQQIRTQDILTPYFNADIDAIRDQINEFHYYDAIKDLERIKSRIWSEAPELIKFRILSNLGSAYYGLGKLEDAGAYFKEAYPYNPDTEISLTNLALAYSFESDDENTRIHAQKVLDKNPSNSNAYNILLQTPPYKNSLEDCLALVPENLKNTGGIAFCLGLAAQNENKFSESLNWFEKAVENEPENPILKGYLGAMLIQSLWGVRSTLLYGQSTDQEEEILNRSIQILSEALLKAENTDLKQSNLSWLLNRGIAKKLLGKTDEAYHDIKQAYDGDPNDPQFIKHLALITLKTKNFLEAGDLFEKIKTDPDIPEVSIFLADFYNSHDQSDKALRVIDEFLVWNSDPRLDFLARRLLIDAYILRKKPDKARIILDGLIADYSDEPSTFLEAAKVTYELETESEAKNFLETARNLVTDQTPVPDIGELGDAFFGLKMYKDAAECYEKIADPEQDTIFTYKLVNAYYHASVLSKVLSICRYLREKYGMIANYGKIEIWTLEEINDLYQESEIAQKYLIKFPDDLRVKIKLAQASFFLEDYSTIDEILSESFDIDKLPMDVGIVISKLMASRGQIKTSFNLMYELRRKYFQQADIHSFYQANFLMQRKEDLDWLQSDSVAADTAVCVEGVDKRKKWFIIEERENGDLAKDEFNINHPLVSDMLGKKVGDQFRLKSSSQNAETGKIVEIKNKFVYASHKTAEIYETAFPDRTDFRSIHVEEPDNAKNNSGHEKIRGIISGNSENSKEGLNFYHSEFATIGMLGKYLGLGGLEIWNRLLNAHETIIFTSNGDLNFLENTVVMLAADTPYKMVADITSLQLMYELNIGDEIVSCFGKLLIAPSTRLSLSQIIKEKERNILTGYLTLIEENGQLYKHEVSPEQVESAVNYLKEFQTWVKNNTQDSPYQSGFDIDRDEKEDTREAFLPEFYDSMLTVEDENCVLFTEDDRLRQFAQLQFGVKGVWMQSVLGALKRKNLITSEKYDASLVRLLTSNLQFINTDAKSLIEVGKTVDWIVNDYFRKALNRLSGSAGSELMSSLIVAAEFLLRLAKENLNARTEKSLIICLLESVTYGRDLWPTINNLQLLIDIKFILLPFGKMRVLHILKVWKQVQIFKSKNLVIPL